MDRKMLMESQGLHAAGPWIGGGEQESCKRWREKK